MNAKDQLPTIIVDSREQDPLTFSTLPSQPGTLVTGDYSAEGLEHVLAIERKSVADLVASVSRERDRFERELHRLRGFDVARLLIVGEGQGSDPRLDIAQGRYRSRMSPSAVFGSLAALECRYRVAVVFATDPAHASRVVERLGWYCWRESRKRSGLKAPATPRGLLEGIAATF